MAIEQLAEEVVNEVASNFEEAAEATRKINAAGLGYLAVGLGLGAAVGFYFGYKFNREKIRAEAYKDAEAEVAIMRQVYLDKTLSGNDASTTVEWTSDTEGNVISLQGSVSTEKPPIEEIIKKQGYSTNVPYHQQSQRPLPAPVPILDDLPENPTPTSKSRNAHWDYEEELKSRTPDEPYVIHQDEYNRSNLNYNKVVYTYYADDDVVTNSENDHPIPHGDIVVGLDNLKFGHGSDDSEVVYVRNDRLMTDMQICRLNASFEEEVLGMENMRSDDDDDDVDDS